MTQHSFHFDHALLPEGWRRDVRVAVAGGLVAAVSPDTAPAPTDERHPICMPGARRNWRQLLDMAAGDVPLP